MRSLFIVLCLGAVCLVGCGWNKLANANSSNAAQNAEGNSNSQAANDALPVFSDAGMALAEANKLFDLNKTDLAIEAYNQAVKLDPDLGEAWFKLGIAYALVEKEKELEAVNDQTEYTPTPTPSKKEKNEQAVRTKDSEKAFEMAVKAYKKVLAANPNDDVAHYNLGRTYGKLDEDETALKSLREAAKLKPDSSEYQIELGSMLIKLAQYDEAVRVLKKALEIDPENSEAEELLDKADAGRKRINFSVTPKPSPSKSDTNSMPKASEKPTPENKTPGTPKLEPKRDKKGDN